MITIGIKEILVILGIVAFMVWLRMFRVSMEEGTEKFLKKLKAPADGTGFGWRGLLVAFIIGAAVCVFLALMAYRFWWGYQPSGATVG